MLSIQECVNKTIPQRKKIEEFMDSNRYFDAKECNPYEGLKRSTQRELQETLRKARLTDLLKEYLITPKGLTTGTLGAAGAQYLIPTWLSQKLYYASNTTDIVPLISADVFEPFGSQCTVPAGLLTAQTAGEGELPHSPTITAGGTLTLERLVVPSIITNEMIEDNQFGIVEWHIQQAGEAMGRLGSDKALAVLKTATDGYGAVVTATGANSAETLTGEILDLWEVVSTTDPTIRPIGNTMIITPEAYSHSVAVDATAAYFTTTIVPQPPATGFDLKFHNLDTIFSSSNELGTNTAGAMTLCKTIIFDRTIAMITGRKNWLRIENYANPIADLAGAVISGRQDSVTVVDAAIGVLTEKA